MVVPPGTDQCRPCQQRSAAVREAVKPEPASTRARTCERDGHHACEHYVAILAVMVKWIEDTAWCAVCGSEIPDDAADDVPMKHKPGCALARIREV